MSMAPVSGLTAEYRLPLIVSVRSVMMFLFSVIPSPQANTHNILWLVGQGIIPGAALLSGRTNTSSGWGRQKAEEMASAAAEADEAEKT